MVNQMQTPLSFKATSRFMTILLLSLLFTSAASLQVFANDQKPTVKQPDETQPVNITADSLKSSEKSGKSIYNGNVIVTQGSLTLKGDVIEISHPKGELKEVIARGKPATFKRYSQVDQAWLKGQAQKIQYNTANKTVLLVGDAQVEQPGKHIIKGPELFYDISNQTLQAQSTETEKKRISVTFNPVPVKKQKTETKPQNTQPKTQ